MYDMIFDTKFYIKFRMTLYTVQSFSLLLQQMGDCGQGNLERVTAMGVLVGWGARGGDEPAPALSACSNKQCAQAVSRQPTKHIFNDQFKKDAFFDLGFVLLSAPSIAPPAEDVNTTVEHQGLK